MKRNAAPSKPKSAAPGRGKQKAAATQDRVAVYGEEDLAGEVEDGAGFGRWGDFAPVISARIFAVIPMLTVQAESLMRHWASVSEQPQVQDSALKR
jgi:hypothetical protein